MTGLQQNDQKLWNKEKKLSEETKKKISKSHFGKKHSEETKQKMSEAQKGVKNHNFGGTISQAHKEILRRFHLGRKHTEESKRKMSEALKGEKNPNFGKKPSIETRKKISEAAKKRTDGHLMRMNKAKKGIPLSALHREKIGKASKKAWAKRKLKANEEQTKQC